jgi:hypothetical protein
MIVFVFAFELMKFFGPGVCGGGGGWKDNSATGYKLNFLVGSYRGSNTYRYILKIKMIIEQPLSIRRKMEIIKLVSNSLSLIEK